MTSALRRKNAPAAGAVVNAAKFKAEALAVMRRVAETGQAVTVPSRGKALVRIEPVREEGARTGYGWMKGTVTFLVPDEQLVSTPGSGPRDRRRCRAGGSSTS